MSPSAGARHIGSRARRAPESVSTPSTTSARSDRRGADTCASLQARGARCRRVARCGSAAGAPDQEVVRREALGLGRFDVHLRQRSDDASASAVGVENFFARALSQCSGQRGFDRSHQRSQAPPMFGAPGGMNFQVMVRTSASFFTSRVPLCMFISSLFAPTKFVPLSEYITRSSSSSDESTQSQYHGV
ncbi:hypothetical protein EVAR_91821_1 [Eumeta japonica]|uniref:Uncharacterized protein n=1 Tax=Eumeta variegata TaxID=151549 RepID=A0A4C1T8Z2_EUMVA|nr:hypothetical protein EVAR_91821_1 [Eumeta japonica]